MHTFENRLSWLYTWRQPGKKKEKPKKKGANAPQLGAIRCLIDFCGMRYNEKALYVANAP